MMLACRVCPVPRLQIAHHLSRYSSSIRSLQGAFRDPSSPFYLAPGARGPDSPDAPVEQTLSHDGPSAVEARRKLTDLGYNSTCFWEQKICWGDHDSFQHVNNTRYVRFFESGRIEYITALGRALGGPSKAQAMIKGQGISLILKSISVNFKRPVTYPDTLLIGHKPYLPSNVTKPKYHFNFLAAAYSYSQQAIVAESDSVCVWYDYDTLKKCNPGEETWTVLLRGMDQARD